MRITALAAAAVTGSVILLPACRASTHVTTPTTTATTAAPTTVATTPAPTPPTTVWRPTAPAPSGEEAAANLVAAWRSGSHAEAIAVATPAAVAALLAQPYPPAGVQFRSCGQQAPLVCTYRNLDTNGIYDLAVVPGRAGGWYVQSVMVES